jgi:hypothetical protein
MAKNVMTLSYTRSTSVPPRNIAPSIDEGAPASAGLAAAGLRGVSVVIRGGIRMSES